MSSGAIPRMVTTALVAVVSAAALCACNGPGAAGAADTARSFEQLAPEDPATACDLLSGHTREAVEKQTDKGCAEGLADADLPKPSQVQSVDVYGHDARVVMSEDVVFLARFEEGWKVTAAGCRPGAVEDEPYDCDVSGG